MAIPADAYEQGLSVVTLSKPWGGCGVTIGWIAFQVCAVRARSAASLPLPTDSHLRSWELDCHYSRLRFPRVCAVSERNAACVSTYTRHCSTHLSR
eukprot:3499697-Rhodomonas_salina.7